MAAIALLTACGGGSNDSSATPSSSGSGTPVLSASGTPIPGVTSTPGVVGSGVADCTTPSSTPKVGPQSDLAVNNDGVYQPGEAVEITLTLSNCADNSVILTFASSKRYDFSVQDSNRNVLWSSSDGRVYDQTIGTEEIQPKQTSVYSETWDQKNRDGDQVADGTYRLFAYSVGCANATQANCQFGPVEDITIGTPASTTPTAPPSS